MTRLVRNLAMGVLLSGVLAGCSSQFEETPPPLTAVGLPEVPPTYVVRPEDVPGVVDGDWIRSFKDEKLVALVDEAMAHNLTLKGTAARRDEAAARSRRAGTELSPEVILGGGGGGGGPIESSATADFNLGLQASWEIDLWGRLGNAADAAALDAVAARADYRAARQSLAAQVAQSWFILTGLTQQRDLDQRNLESQRQAFDIVEVQVDVGAALPADLNLARAELSQAQEQLTRTNGQVDDAARSLELLLGRYPKAELSSTRPLSPPPPPTPAGLPSELLERRPDIVAFDRRVAAAFNRTASTKAARMPRLSLTGGIGGASDALTSVLNPSNIVWNLLANFAAPIFDGGRRQADVQIATKEQETALVDYADASLKAFGEVETALANETVLRDREVKLNRIVEELRRAEDLTMARYEEGSITYIDVNQIRRQRIDAEKQWLGLKVERLKQRATLHLVLGGSFSEDETPLRSAQTN